MSLDLGQLIGSVLLEDVQFQRTYTRVVQQFSELGTRAEGASTGAATLDRALNGVAQASAVAATSMDRVAVVTNASTVADDKASAAAAQHARATAAVAAAMNDAAGASTKDQVAALRLAAAQDRVNAVNASGTATTRSLAGAQATLAAASDKVEASQKRALTAIGAFSKGAVLVGGVLGVLSLKQASEFQQATNVYVTAAGEAVSNLGVVRTGIEKVATDTGTSVKNLTDAEYLIEKAGVRGADGLKILSAAAQGAREENAQLSDVVQAMTSVMASYHLGADQSVQVMNALKTGAGQAKVTMEEYAKSLSTVIPIASANKIGLDQVLGALSTLTQHGTTANEATQELSATIRSLAAPNNVAKAAMQQLGLSVTDVTGKIGERGLTGTIDLLVNAITAKMGKSGLVIVDAMRKSQSATADLQTELAAMPAPLKSLAEQFDNGTLSYKEYYAGIKALGAPLFEMGMNFKSTEAQAKGFNTLLTSGQPAAQTFTAALKSVSGGAIGLNTILQLSGANMAGFQERTDAVGKSLSDSSTQVEGWASTQKLFAVETDRAKESLQVMGIEIGTHLLPAATKAMDWIATDGVADLQTLGHFLEQNRVAISIVGGAVAGMWATWKGYQIATAAGTAIRAAYTYMSGAVTAFTAQFGTSTASVQASNLRQQANFAATATRVRVAMAEEAEAAAQAAAQIAESTAATGSVLADGAAATARAKAEEAAAYRSAATSATEAAAQIELAATTAAEVADTEAAASGVAWDAMLGPVGLIAGGVAAAIGAFHLFGGAAKSQIKPTQDLTQAILDDADAYGVNTRAIVKNKLEKDGAYDSAAKYGISQQTLTDAMMGSAAAVKTVNDIMTKYLATLNAHQRAGLDWISQKTAAIQFQQTLGGVTDELQVNLQAANNLLNADGKLTAQQRDAAKADAARIVSLGGTAKEAAAVAKAYELLPANKKTTVTLEDYASSKLKDIRSTLANLTAMRYIINVQEVLSGGVANLGNGVKAKAAGGTVGGHSGPTADDQLTLLSTGEEVINANQASKHRGLLKAINAGVAGFAAGGTVGASYTSSSGISYASQLAADNANTRALTAAIKALETTQREYQYTYLPNFIKALGGTTSSLENAGRSLIAEVAKTAQAHEVSAKLVTQIAAENAQLDKLAVQRDTIGAKLKTANAALAAAVQAEAQEAASITANIASFNLATDTPATPAAGSTSPDAARQAAVAAAQAATTAALANGATQAEAAAAAAQAAAAAMAAAASSSSGMGGIQGVVQDLSNAVQRAIEFKTEMAQLAAMGLNTTDLQQLADAGDTDATMQRLQDLLSASPDQIKQINQLTAQLGVTAKSAGDQIAGSLYAAGIAADKGLVAGLKASEGEVTAEMKKLADAMVASIKAALGIHSPSTVTRALGRNAGSSVGLGLADSVGIVRASAASLAGAAIPKITIPRTYQYVGTLPGASGQGDMVGALRAEIRALGDRLDRASDRNARATAELTTAGHAKVAQSQAARQETFFRQHGVRP